MAEMEFVTHKYVWLPRDKATLHELITHVLYFRDVKKSTNLLCHNIPQEKENKYIHKEIILFSHLIQSLLKHAAFLPKLGYKLERFLNGNISDEKAAGFVSFVGHLDTRTELDREIKNGDARYLPALSMMASKLAYENRAVVETVVSQQWKMKFEDFYDLYNEFQGKKETQAFIFREVNADNDMAVVAFRGTSPFNTDDWITDLDISWCQIKGMGKLHMGFMTALGLKKYSQEDEAGDHIGYWPKQNDENHNFPLAYYTIREKLKEIMGNNKKGKFIVTGHSLGGALAILFPAILALHKEWELLDRLEAIYTFGQPRVGDKKFAEFMRRTLRDHQIKYYRIVYGYDGVPCVPLDNAFMMFKHFGNCIQFNTLYQGKIIEEDDQAVKKNEKQGWLEKGLRLLSHTLLTIIGLFILGPLHAVWELIRSFIIEFTAGPDFKEGWLLRVCRVCGLLLPWIVDHCPGDYVNATRLASEDLFLN